MTWVTAARFAAIGIAIAGAADPAMTRPREVPVRVAVIAPPGSGALDRLRATLDRFTLADGVSPDSQAVIVVSDGWTPLPSLHEGLRAFVVRGGAAAALRVERLDVPAAVLTDRLVNATVRVAPANRTDALNVSLYAADRLVAQETLEAETLLASHDLTLSFAAARTGLIPVRLESRQGDRVASATTGVRVVRRPLRVHFEDPQPSWRSTFIRRALEEDSAFAVTSNASISRGLAAASGDPVELNDPSALESIDVIVAGTPSAASGALLTRLERFARERGGTVVLLADEGSQTAITRLAASAGWTRRAFGENATLTSAAGSLRVSEALVASELPATATGIVAAPAGAIVAEFPLGHGRVIVSGAIDAWRHRVEDAGGFGHFWRGVIADAAVAATRRLAVTVSPQTPRPGETVEVEVALRTASDTAEAEAWLDVDGTRAPVRLWPTARPGVFEGRVRIPHRTATARVVAQATADDSSDVNGELEADANQGVAQSEAPLAIDATYEHVSAPLSEDDLKAFAAAHSGTYIQGGDVASLATALDAAFPSNARPVDIHPMRSPFWIAPFALCLGVEWHARRRRGLK